MDKLKITTMLLSGILFTISITLMILDFINDSHSLFKPIFITLILGWIFYLISKIIKWEN